MRSKAALTLPEMLVAILLVTMLLCLLLPACTSMGAKVNPSKVLAQLKTIHDGMGNFAASNGSYLPGMNSSGVLLDSTDQAFASLTGGNTGARGLGGGAMNTRYYLLLKGKFVSPDLIVSPLDKPSAFGLWSNPAALPNVAWPSDPTGQFSYALSNIADSETAGAVASKRAPGRAGEWRDDANSHAIIMVDRNSGESVTAPRSVWSESASGADWRGCILWVDGHSEYLLKPGDLTTRYLHTTNTGDNLFTDDEPTAPLTERAPNHDNAMFNYLSMNY